MLSEIYKIKSEDISLLNTYLRHNEGLEEFLAAVKVKIVEYFGEVRVRLSMADDIWILIEAKDEGFLYRNRLHEFDVGYWYEVCSKYDCIHVDLEYT